MSQLNNPTPTVPAEFPAVPAEGEMTEALAGHMKRQTFRYKCKGEAVTINFPITLLPEGPFPFSAFAIIQIGASQPFIQVVTAVSSASHLPLHLSAEEAAAGVEVLCSILV